MSSFFPYNLDELRVLKSETGESMADQNAQGPHGRDMHPQGLQRLVGCHDGAGDPPHSVRLTASEIMARVISGF